MKPPMDLFTNAEYPTATELTHRDKWLNFHLDNPDVYAQLVKLARGVRASGRGHYGIATLFEVLRYHHALKTTDDTFRLNNNYRAFYARLIMIRCPDLADFFSTRVQNSELKTARDGPTRPDDQWRTDPFWTRLA